MDRLARFTLEHPRFTWLLIVAIVAAGVSAYGTQPRQEDPEITLRAAQVVTHAPGLSPERVEQLITRPIEEAIKQISEVDEIRSVSMTGVSIVTPEIAPQFDDVDAIWTRLRNKMADLEARLPTEAHAPIVNDDYGQVAVVTLALTGADYSMAELNEVARDLTDELGSLPLVGRVDLYGVQEERIWLEFDAHFLAQFSVNTADIVSSLRGQNIVLPGGTIDAAGLSVVIEPSGNFDSVDEIRNLPISTGADGGILYLRDIAKVRRAYQSPPSAPAFYDGVPAIVLGLSMIEDSNVVELGRNVSRALERLRPNLPLGMNLDVAIYQPDLVQASVRTATTNLAQTMFVVLAVVMVFLGWRMGLIVGAMVPLTMLLTLVGMAIGDIALHRVSIAAIIVALGLLVDNGVVIAEDIRQRLDRGTPRRDAALGTTRSLALPLLTSSLTTILAFMPLIMIEDTTGEFLRSLGQVLALSLLTSWVLAVSLTPALCYWLMPDSDATSQSAPPTESATYRRYRRFLEHALAHRVLVLGVALLLLFAAIQVFQLVRERSLGPSERNQFTVYLDLPAGSDIDSTISATRRLTNFLIDEQRNPEIESVLSYVGSGGPRFFLALAPNDPQPNKAFLVVTTDDAEDVSTMMERVEWFIAQDVPEATGRAELLFLGPAALGTVELRVRGPKIETLRRIGNEIENAFHEVEGTRAVRSDWENAVLKLRVEIDQERARRAGVSSEEVATALSTIFDGTTVTHFREDDRVIPVVIRAQADQRDSFDRIRSVEIFSPSLDQTVSILQIADIGSDVEPSRIMRFDQRRALTIAGKHPDLTAVELLEAIQPSLDRIVVPTGYAVTVEGEIKGSNESNGKLLAFAPHALFGIALLLVLQFDSYRRPVIILLTIPLVLVGANFALALTGAYFDFTAMLGLFSLAGIIVNNGIVLIERIDQARASGLRVDAAVVDAAVARARPIIMTTITTVVGLLPLALMGGEFWFGMSVVIMGGLAVGTLLTLGFVPVLYSLLFSRDDSSWDEQADADLTD